jgi:prolyl-tRNA synthetase
LPLGLRTLSKIVKIIDEEMESVGGQKLNMPKLLPKELWEKTGRWNDMGSELVRLKDRKGEDFCLAPTHEEVVTSLAAAGISSHKQLPLRLYQIGDKYRDEARPRFGLLRAREFVMKDMYSFDLTQADAMATYEEVRGAYNRVMTRLEIPYAIAEADSGNIGGNLSHEFHALADVGEDSLLCCPSSQYHANVEKAKSATVANINISKIPPTLNSSSSSDASLLKQLLEHLASPLDQTTLRATIFTDPSKPEFAALALTDVAYEANPYLVKGTFKLGADYTFKPLDKDSIQRFLDAKDQKVVLDKALVSPSVSDEGKSWISKVESIFKNSSQLTTQSEHVKIVKPGDKCNCGSSTCPDGVVLEERKGIEVGHLFYLGTKYSVPLKANVSTNTGNTPIEMGCYGIGVSRLLAVAVETSNDAKGIVWPHSIAPFRVTIIPMKQTVEQGDEVYRQLCRHPKLTGDVMLDDRYTDSIGYRVKESEFIGIPYAVVLGSKFKDSGKVEVISRKDGQSVQLTVEELHLHFAAKFNQL